MKNKFFILLVSLFVVLLLSGCGKSAEKKEVTINIIDENSTILYNKKIKTKQEDLLSLLEELPVEVKYKDLNSSNGTYIVSLLGKDEKKENSNMYYWVFYVNDNPILESISVVKLEDKTTYKFVYEKTSY